MSATVTVTLSPSSIMADGLSTGTATATLRFGAGRLAGQTVAFSSSDSGIRFGPSIDNLDGTYTATLTSSTAVGTPTITATSRWGGQTASGQATLTEVAGLAKHIALGLEPPSIVADGRSYTTAVATVTDAHGNAVSTDTVAFSSTDPQEQVSEVSNNGNGGYSALIRSSRTPGRVGIEATDAAANVSVRSELIQTAGAGSMLSPPPSAGSMLSLVTMQWTFYHTPVYTKVRSLVVNGLPADTSVLIECRGRGCPFTKRLTVIAKTRRCGPKGTRRCAARATMDLTPKFQNHRLHVGARITVAITRPLWTGKYYVFNTRARLTPRVWVGCLPPGQTRPRARC